MLQDKKIVATIEARMTSTRLPGKVLLPLSGTPVLQVIIDRLKRSSYLDEIVVATTVNDADDPIVSLAKNAGVKHFRGSEFDVLGRVLGAAESVAADIIVEITGDCPFVDPRLVDRAIEEYAKHNVDYASNTMNPTFPNGFDVQVFSRKVLAHSATLTNDPIDRVQVSCFIFQHPELYTLHNWVAGEDCHGPELRVTLDEHDDYRLITAVYEHLHPKNNHFSAADVVALLRERPDLVAINKYVRQKDISEG